MALPDLQLFNTLTRTKSKFLPLLDIPTMYVCGPTVYARAHLGNARSTVVYDILFRLLKFKFGNCLYVRNITDVDDKIIDVAKTRGVSMVEIAEEFTLLFHSDMAFLGCETPTFEPRATKHLDEMVQMIRGLVDKGIAYITKGGVYFSVQKFKDYGQLSGRHKEDQLENVRLEANADKCSSRDFALWKLELDESEQDFVFPSPWGAGRPGWHIECSAMATKYLGQTFDIHGGGADLKFPHHENEIAQSCALYDDSEFAKYWIHNGFLTLNGQKMSKSTGNFLTVADLRSKDHDGDLIRFVLLSSHYSKPLNFDEKLLKAARESLNSLKKVAVRAKNPGDFDVENLPYDFIEALFDDINTPLAFSILHQLKSQILHNDNDVNKDQAISKLAWALNFLGFSPYTDEVSKVNPEFAEKIERLMSQRSDARANKNYIEADRIKKELLKLDITVKDNPTGSEWEINKS